MDKFKKLEQIVNLVESDKITRTEFAQLFSSFVTVVKELKTNIESKIDDSSSENNNAIKDVAYSLSELELKLRDLVNTSERSSLVKIKDLSQRFFQEINRVESLIPEVKDFTQEISNLERIINEIPAQVPQVIETGETIVDKINSIEDDSEEVKIDASHIRNLPKSVERIVERIGGGGASMVRVLDNGAVIGDTVTEINFTNATSITYTGGATGRRANITTGGGGGGGGGVSVLTATGTVNGSNTSFTFTSAPSMISVDGVLLRQTSSDGTVNWTGTTSITLTVAPTFDIFGIASSSIITATGTVDGSNTSFVFASAPSMIVVDQGRIMRATSSDGTVNWTGTTSVTLTIAPTFDIYGL